MLRTNIFKKSSLSDHFVQNDIFYTSIQYRITRKDIIMAQK